MIWLPHLETDVTTACQYSCVACNHHVPMYRAKGVRMSSVAQVEEDLNSLARFVHTEAWGAIGGEPLLHRGLVDILRVARESRIADNIEVWTNGALLDKMPPAFWKAIDRLVLSAYPGKITDERVEDIVSRCSVEGVQVRVVDERKAPNFKTLFEPSPTGPEQTARKFAGCFFRNFSRVVDWGFFFTCCCAPHMTTLVQGEEFGTDGVRISGTSEEELRAYLNRTTPLGVCSICAGRDTAVAIPWHEEREPKSWLEASTGKKP